MSCYFAFVDFEFLSCLGKLRQSIIYIVSSAISILNSKKGEILQEGTGYTHKLHMTSGGFHLVSHLEIYN